MTTRADARDFGSDIGRGMQGLAAGVDRMGDAVMRVRALEAEAQTKDRDVALSNSLRDLQYNPDSGFLLKEGKTAVDGWADYQKGVDEAILKNGEGLTGEAARMYRQSAEARKQSALQGGIVHTAQAKKSWFKTSSESRMESFQQDAFASYGDPKMVDKNIAAGLAELQTRAELEGWDADTLKVGRENYVSTIRKGVIARMVEQDPIAAEKYYLANKSQITGSDQFAVETAMRDELVNEKSKREASRILSGAAKVAPGVQGVAGPRVVAGGDLTLGLLRQKEGFRSTPYWDVNAWRTGYGSDTFTRADGSVGKVTTGTTVSRADAERDLQRRVAEFQRGIAEDVGGERWRSLPPHAQAALTSVAYNYGRLPGDVASAVRSGDTEAIAQAIAGRATDNGGVNRNRRNNEAAIVRGQGAPVAGGSAPSFVDMEQQIAAISDPDIREATRKRLYSLMEAQEKQQQQAKKAAELELFAVVDRGGTPDDVSAETRLAAGMSSVSSAWSYHEARTKRGEPETDQTLLYELRRAAAVDPVGFSQRNLMEFRDRLDNAAFKEMTDQQTSALKDGAKAVQTGSVYADAYKQADTALDAVGLTTTGLGADKNRKKREEMSLRLARFQNALKDSVDEFRDQNNGRVPTYAETQAMINRLLLPVVIKTPGTLWGTNDTEGFAFDAAMRPDGSTVEINVKIDQIPVDLRAQIAADIEAETGTKPTNDEIVERYEAFVTGR
jgi:GH24 family phage-related lysozyme (muramidase)